LKSKADSKVDAPEFRDEKKPVYVVQLEKAKSDYERLQARVDSDKAIARALKKESRDILEGVALALILAAEAADAVKGQALDQERITRTVHGFPMPGASVRGAIYAQKRLISGIGATLNAFYAARNRNYAPDPNVPPPPPSVRCGHRGCKRYGERVRTWDEFCGKCSNRYSRPGDEADYGLQVDADSNESLTNR
jgi:hypothetical protein